MSQGRPAAKLDDVHPHLRQGWMILASLVLLCGSGCRIPGLYCAEPGPYLPEDYNGQVATANSADTGLEEFFDEPTLTQLITEGIAQNQELKIRSQEIQIAYNEIMARRGSYLPFVTAGVDGGVLRSSRFMPLGAAEGQLKTPTGGVFPDPLPYVGVSTNLIWQIDYLRQLRNARDAATWRYYEAIDSRDYLITKIVADIAENYYELAALDQRIVYLQQTIALQQKSLEVARAQKATARGTELGVQRFLAEVRKNESQKYIVEQKIIEAQNRINFLAGRYPQPVERQKWDFIQLASRTLHVGVPAQLLQNRRDIRAAEREIAAAGLDVAVARANFFPKIALTAGVGYESFNARYLIDPGSFVAGAAGGLIGPLINKRAIRAEYLNANAQQLQAIYNYQRTVINAFTEVVNQLAKVENYRQSVELKANQVKALEESVNVATNLFQAARPEVEYIDVLFAQRDLLEARTDLIETKQQQLSAIVSAYQALGGGVLLSDGVWSSELLNNTLYEEWDGEMLPSPEELPTPPDATEPPVNANP